jgi:DNA-binding NarL/FixJ family response regulator
MSPDTLNLTRREVDVLACLIAGKSNREIAEELRVSMSTVKAHLSSLYNKLGVSSRTQAALVGLGMVQTLRGLAS